MYLKLVRIDIDRFTFYNIFFEPFWELKGAKSNAKANFGILQILLQNLLALAYRVSGIQMFILSHK